MFSSEPISDTSKVELKKYNRNLFQVARGPLIIYGCLAAAYVYESNLSWFSWHPFCMIVAFITLAGNAILIKKIGGYENTKYHGYIMAAACAIGSFGYYVIYTNKEISKKKHLLTIHGKLGTCVMAGYTLVAIVGALALHPDFGILRENTIIRIVHRWSGRALTALAWAVSVLGFMNMKDEMHYQALFAIPLFLLGMFMLV